MNKNQTTQTTTLSEIAEIRIGYQSRSAIESDQAGSYYLVQGKDIQSNLIIDWDSVGRFSPGDNPLKALIEKDDILFLARGNYNIAVHVKDHIPKAVAGGSLFILRLKSDSVLPGFVAWWLNSDKIKVLMINQRSGTSIPFISKAMLTDLVIAIPDLATQQRIVTIDALLKKEIELNAKLIEEKQKLINNICNQVLNS